MRLALDTNTYSEAAKSHEKAVQILRSVDEIFLPFIVLAELRAGFAVADIGKKNEARLTEFLSSPRVQILLADEQTTHHYAQIYAYLRKKGAPIPTNDLWIAALVLQHNLLLYSNDQHFKHIPQLMLI